MDLFPHSPDHVIKMDQLDDRMSESRHQILEKLEERDERFKREALERRRRYPHLHSK